MPLDDQQLAALRAELARRRVMVWIIGVCFVGAVIAASAITPWLGFAAGVLGVLVMTMAIARYRELVAAVQRASG